VTTLGLFNFGIESDGPNQIDSATPAPTMKAVRALKLSVLVINGGTTDAMMAPSKATFEALGNVPAFYGSRAAVGHVGTMFHPGGGEFANVASDWLLWRLKHDRAAREVFLGDPCGLCTNPKWTVASNHLSR
jgi:hypothetical protein